MHGLNKPTATTSIETLRVEMNSIHKRARGAIAERLAQSADSCSDLMAIAS
jgi:hypothetical protein